jgi:VWFA-related protein
LLLGLVPALFAQKTSETQTSTATVRVQTSLVVVPAIITDRQGNPVEDLGKNDFILKEDGKPQTISVFEHIQRQPGIDVKIPVPEGVYTNRVKQNQPARLTIIGVDAVSTGMLEKLETRKQILEFISKNVSLEQPVALFLLQESGVKVLHDFSTDPRVLIAALDHITGGRTAADAIVHDQQTANERTAQGEKMKAVFDEMVRAETDTIQTSFLSFTNLQQKRMSPIRWSPSTPLLRHSPAFPDASR